MMEVVSAGYSTLAHLSSVHYRSVVAEGGPGTLIYIVSRRSSE